MDNGQKGQSPEPIIPMRLHVPSAKAEDGVIRAGEGRRGSMEKNSHIPPAILGALTRRES